MNSKLYSIFAVAFAFVLGFGAINQAMAASGSYNHDYGRAVLIGVDEAANSIGVIADRDVNENATLQLVKSDSYNRDYGQSDLFAVDEAHNSAGSLSDRDTSDMDRNSNLSIQDRGLSGNYSEER